MPYINILVDLNESHSTMFILYIAYTDIYIYIIYIYTEIARLSIDLTEFIYTNHR